MRNLPVTALVAAALLALWCPPAAAEWPKVVPRAPANPGQAYVTISFQADGRVDAFVMVSGPKAGKRSVRNARAWTEAIGSLLGGPAQAEGGEGDVGGGGGGELVYHRFDLEGGVRRDGWLRYLDADPRPLLALLGQARVGDLYLQITIADKQGFSECTLPETPLHEQVPPDRDIINAVRSGWYRRGQRLDTSAGRFEIYHYQFPVTEDSVPPFRVTYGYRPRDFLALAPLALLPLPVLWILRRRRRVVSRTDADPVEAWWGYSRFLRRLELGIALAWAFVVVGTPEGTLLDRLAHFALGSSAADWPLFVGWDWLSLAVYALPPAVTVFLCAYLSYPVYTRVRNLEWTRSDMAWHALTRHAAPLFYMVLIAAALAAAGNWDWHRCVTLAMVFVLVAFVLPRLRPASRRRLLQPLDTGVVRDRVFELAQRAGVQVKQVYLWPTRRDRSANAAAAVGNKVLLSDYLLQHMSKRQVDWVVAHELVHLRHRHPGGTTSGGSAVGFAFVAFFALSILSGEFAELPPALQTAVELAMRLRFGLLLLVVPGSVWAENFRKRRNEFVADGEAVAVAGGDAEAGIAALGRMSRLNAQPERWSWLDETLATHPSNSRRVQALADENDIDPERVPAILAAADQDEDRYPLPAELLRDERLLLTELKVRRSSAVQWCTLALVMLLPALLARGFDALSWSGTAAWSAAGGGVVLALLLLRLTLDYAVVRGERWLREQLCARWKAAGLDVEAGRGMFVALAPGRVLRLYESSFDWDFGFLLPAGDRLCYVGCQTSFALPRDRVKAVRLGPGAPRWGKSIRVYLTWSDDAGVETTWNLRPAGEINLHGVVRQTPHLLRALEDWQREATSVGTPPEPLSSLQGPAVGKVTFATVASYLRAIPFRQALITYAIFTASLAFLFGCWFGLFPSPGWGWYAPALSSVMLIFQRMPFWLYREPRLPKEPGVSRTAITRTIGG